jgi:carbamoyl-phosphate synthase small subunit
MSDVTPAYLVLADGTVFEGEAFGAPGVALGEVVFSTASTGYEESLTDPSFFGQVLVLTTPEIGNVGINGEDAESRDGAPTVRGLVVRHLSRVASNYRSKETLGDWLARHGVVGISGIDTRKLTHHLREHGSQNAALGTADVETLRTRAREAPSMAGQNLVPFVTPKASYRFEEGRGAWTSGATVTATERKRVAVYDFGTKKNILRHLVDLGCEVTVLPATTSAEDCLSLAPDGIFLTNGPGDPAAATAEIGIVRDLVERTKVPVFGICLGHQLLALALGAKTFKLKFGHRGVNQPVMDTATQKVEITAQNHGFCVDSSTLPEGVSATHVHLNDRTNEGLVARGGRVASVQFHPEAAAGPHDSAGFFRRFLEAMDAHRA